MNKNRLFFQSLLARSGCCTQKNKEKKWIPVVSNREKKTSVFIDFINLCLLGKDFVCNKMTLAFYDGASDIFLRYFNITMVPAILF